MKYLFFTVSIFLMASLAYCNSNKADATNNKSEPAAQNTSSSSSIGNAIFSYNLDGTKISGGEVDSLMMSNVAAVTKSSTNPDKLSFFLNDAYKDNTETVAHSLRFEIPDKTGTVILIDGENNGHVELFLASGEDKYVVYGNEPFTVTVTNVSSSHVSGTFSGKVKLAESAGTGKSELAITDGKFDIPIKHTAN
ncbi:MAG: hypothetical protein M3R50_03400 [Bacteroidota bacterium]|nr:hypothetical protein [Bacteroidota bacterium]